MTHSHGGSVAMLASQNGLEIGPLGLLSCPVHFPKYMPDFNRVGKIVSIHVKFDWVIWLDGGAQRFDHLKIKEIVLPIWFNHSATHDPDVWRDHNLPPRIPDSNRGSLKTMHRVKLIALFLAGAIWRAIGIRDTGRTLVRALGTNDEQLRMVAGMMLVKSGKKAEPLLQEALARRESVPVVLTVLASIGDPAVEPQLRPVRR